VNGICGGSGVCPQENFHNLEALKPHFRYFYYVNEATTYSSYKKYKVTVLLEWLIVLLEWLTAVLEYPSFIQ